MNVLLVRTKLQAVIALELVNSGTISRPFVFVPLYRNCTDEDSPSVRRMFAQLAGAACHTVPIVQSRGLVRGALTLTVAVWIALLTRGKLFAAVIDYYALAVALRLSPCSRLVSFDDGAANTQLNSRYHAAVALGGSSTKRRIAQRLFPDGSAAFCRSRIVRHYSLFPGRPNIVPRGIIQGVAIAWEPLLSRDDRLRLGAARPRTVMLGTVFEEQPEAAWDAAVRASLGPSDVFIPHPRERARPQTGARVIYTDAPAESALVFWARGADTPITVLHFNSSVADVLGAQPGLTFVDLTRSGPEAHGRCRGARVNV